MQTFLPFPDVRLSAESLDDSRLNKQIVESYQILKSLLIGDGWIGHPIDALSEAGQYHSRAYGHQNHPATRMWTRCEVALLDYTRTFLEVHQERGVIRRGIPYDNSSVESMVFWIEAAVESDLPQHGHITALDSGSWPVWFGWPTLHESHRACLMQKWVNETWLGLDPETTEIEDPHGRYARMRSLAHEAIERMTSHLSVPFEDSSYVWPFDSSMTPHPELVEWLSTDQSPRKP